jgi:2-polyprenyl-3-methyl-5-hydroxy-6-metoxy-1,4-benzoquinol methylase
VHAVLTRTAAKCIGVDIDAEGVKGLTDAGIFDNLVLADVLTLDRAELPLPHVDFIVAGDIIEHLSSPGSLLDSAARLSDPGTQLVLTTPNALGLPMFIRYLRGEIVEGPDHKVSFNVYTLRNLLGCHGWEIRRLATCHQAKATQLHSGVGMTVGKAVLSRWPSLGGTLFVVAQRDRAGVSERPHTAE